MLNESEEPSQEAFIQVSQKKFQYVMDKLSPQIALRWGIFGGTFFLYLLRVYVVNGW